MAPSGRNDKDKLLKTEEKMRILEVVSLEEIAQLLGRRSS
jgi:hypothetical protein